MQLKELFMRFEIRMAPQEANGRTRATYERPTHCMQCLRPLYQR